MQEHDSGNIDNTVHNRVANGLCIVTPHTILSNIYKAANLFQEVIVLKDKMNRDYITTGYKITIKPRPRDRIEDETFTVK